MKTITTFSPTLLRGKKLFLIALAFFSFIISSHAVESNDISKQQETGEKIRKKRNTTPEVTVHKGNFEEYFKLVGSAEYDKATGTVTLTEPKTSQVGNFTLGTQVNVNHSFTLKGKIFVGAKKHFHTQNRPKLGADGMGFAFHRSPAGHVGAPGGALGIGGLKDAVGIKFDTYMNSEHFNGKGRNEPFFRDPKIYEIIKNDHDETQYESSAFMAFAQTELGYILEELGEVPEGFIPEELKNVPIVMTDEDDASSKALPSIKLKLDESGNYGVWWDIVLTYDGTSNDGKKMMKCDLSYKDKSGNQQTISIEKDIEPFLLPDGAEGYLPYSFSVSASTGERYNFHKFQLESFKYTPVSVAYSRNFELTRGVDGYDVKPISDFIEYRGKLGDLIPTDKQLTKMKADGYEYRSYTKVLDLTSTNSDKDKDKAEILKQNTYIEKEDEKNQGYFELTNQVQGVYYIFEKRDLKIDKEVNTEKAVQNETLEYIIKVKNEKDVAVNEVVIYDALDERLEFISSDNNKFGEQGELDDGRMVLGTVIPRIEAGEEMSFKFTAKIKNNTPSGVIINQALAAFTENDKTETKYSDPVHTVILPGATIEGRKNLTGKEMQEGDFEFEVLEKNGESFESKIRATNKEDGTFELKLAEYLQPGTYHYKIREIDNKLDNIIYDDKEYNLTVDITVEISGDDSSGEVITTTKIITTAIIKDGEDVVTEPVFNNIYIPEITKEVDNATPKLGDEISYTIKPVLPSDIKTNYESYMIVDELPDGLIFVSAATNHNQNENDNWEITNEGNTVKIKAKNFASMPTDTLEITITARVDEKAVVGQTIDNTATVQLKTKSGKTAEKESNPASITPTVSTGINLVKSKSKISLTPNPVVDILHISSDAKIKRIELLDVIGKLVLTKKLANETELTLDLSNFNTGVYYLRVIEEGAFSTLKLIKK